MFLSRLEVKNLRILASVSIRPGRRFNVVVGDNGAGKTSILEAVHVLGTGRSFRTRRVDGLIKEGSEEADVFGEVRLGEGEGRKLGVRKSWEGRVVKVDGEAVGSASRLAQELCVGVFGPDSHRLISEGPLERRRLMDWGLFHVERGYLDAVARYRRALQQRNAALRLGRGRGSAGVWLEELAEYGKVVDRFRRAYAASIGGYLEEKGRALGQKGIDVRYKRGWDDGTELESVLAEDIQRDLDRGYTGRGPHAADLVLRVNGKAARDACSRGQAKQVAAALVLSHVEFVERGRGTPPVLLVDDLASELDFAARKRFLELLEKGESQVFVTALDRQAIEGLSQWDHTLFHVEQGKVTEVL